MADRKPRTDTRSVWYWMMKRCYDPGHDAYENYGAKGVTVCPEWHDYKSFKADMEPRPDGHQLDRIDNAIGYQRDNCRWVTFKQQQRNRTANRYITANGETKTLVEWGEVSGFRPTTIWNRLRRGWSPEDSVSVPALRGYSLATLRAAREGA